MNLKNQVAVVTGGTKGIGLAIAEALSQQEAHVVICSRNPDEVQACVDDLSSRCKAKIRGRKCDVGDADEFERLLDFAEAELGGVDILINNAGIGIFKHVEELTVEEWRNVISTNLDSLFYGCRHVIPKMKRRGGGFIINIGSLAGKNAFPSAAAYNASKFGLIGFSEALMQEVRHDDIRVAYVMPGSVDTWFRGGSPEGGSSWKLSAQDVAEVVVETLQRSDRCLTSRIEMRPAKPPRK